MAKYRIIVEHPRATLYPFHAEVLDPVLRVFDQTAKHTLAFASGRWDGYRALYAPNGSFPSGLVFLVAESIRQAGHELTIVDDPWDKPLDLSRFSPDFLEGITLRDYQYEAAREALLHRRGVLKLATGAGKTALTAAIARYIWQETGSTVLVVVPSVGLAIQSVDEFHKFYRGEVPLGLFSGARRSAGQVTIANVQALANVEDSKKFKRVGRKRVEIITPLDPEVQALVAGAGAILFDEFHHNSAKTYTAVSNNCAASFRLGVSATPLKFNTLNDLAAIGSTGPILYDLPAKQLVAANYLAKPLIAVVAADNASQPQLPPKLPYAEVYRRAVATSIAHNAAVIKSALWLADHGKQTLILCRLRSQWELLKSGLEKAGLSVAAAFGEVTDAITRKQLKDSFAQGKVQVLLGSKVFGEGEDIKNVDAVVFAEGVKINTDTLQRLGRGMRPKGKGLNTVWVVDIIPMKSKKLFDHGLARVKLYEGEGHEIRIVDSWPKVSEPYGVDLLPFAAWEDEMGRSCA